MMGFPGVDIEVTTSVVLILREGVDLQVATIAFLVATILPGSHHRQMVDGPESSSIEVIHRVAAVAR
jgi:hypothetical protein